MIAFATGVVNDLAAAIGCFGGGWIADRVGSWIAFFGSGLMMAAVAILMADAARSPVDDLRRATAGMRLLLGPYEPIENFRVAIVEDHGQPIELIQTTLPDDEIWSRAKTESILLQKPE